MNRVFLLAMLLLCTAGLCRAQQNVIIIIADDLGTDYCGFYEDARDTANMPNIRSLLARGVRFSQAWASPTCSPTRAGILTGRYPFRTGVGTAISGTEYPDLNTSEITLPGLLRSEAPTTYATGNVGKWHLSQRTPEKLNNPAVFGYDFYAGNFLGELSDYFEWDKITNGVSTTSTNYATTETVNDAISWLGTLPKEKPFFLWVAFNAPHTPLHAPPAALHTVPGLTGAQGHINQNPKLYFRAMIEAMDTETGRLFAWLRDNGRWDSTDIIFIGDNGNTRRVSQIADTSHNKGTLYEYGVHVPFIVAGPAVVRPGRTSHALVNTVDLFASALEMCGFRTWRNFIPSSVEVDSRSLVNILADRAADVREWAFTEQFAPTPAPADGKAIRNPEYKLIRFDNGREEMYRVLTDLNETTDLLKRPLDATEQANYDELCTAMNTLLGHAVCGPTVSVESGIVRDALNIYPNPGTAHYVVHGLGNGGAVPYTLITMEGSMAQAGTLPVAGGTAHLEANVPSGRYVLRLLLPNGERGHVMMNVVR